MGGGGGWDYDYSESALKRSSKEYAAEAKTEGVERTYEGKQSGGIAAPVGRRVRSESPTPVVVGVDVTGSMGKWPEVIFSKLPVLYNEAKLHLPDLDISFCAIGDANSDRFPLQVCDFEKGPALEEGLNTIYPEGGGGAGTKESYELAAYYYARHCDMPNAKRALFVFCGDEGFYTRIKVNTIKTTTGETPAADVDTVDVFEELKERFDVYILRVPYNGDAYDQRIEAQWNDALGPQNVLRMTDPARIVDCIIGLAAILADDVDSFSTRISVRQTPAQVKQVLETLHPAMDAPSEES